MRDGNPRVDLKVGLFATTAQNGIPKLQTTPNHWGLMILIRSGTQKSSTPRSSCGIRVNPTGILPASQAVEAIIRACFPNQTPFYAQPFDAMRPIYHVDLERCGGEHLPAEFDLEEFCEVLQGKVPEIEVVATPENGRFELNRTPGLIPDSIFQEALGEYLRR